MKQHEILRARFARLPKYLRTIKPSRPERSKALSKYLIARAKFKRLCRNDRRLYEASRGGWSHA